LSQIYAEDERKWVAVCAEDETHVGYHHQAYKAREIEKHSVSYQEVKAFYRETPFAAGFGLEPRLTGQALQDRFATLKHVLGRDDTGLF
jgi:hypothetical protein